MHASIEQLLRVQAVDNEIRFLETAMEKRPRELDDDRRKLERAKQAVDAVAAKIKEGRLQAQKGEHEIQRGDAEVTKSNIALNQARSNDEYQVIKAQIAKIERERGTVEERVLECLSDIDALEARKAELEAEYATEERSFARKKADVDELLAGLGAKLEDARARRATATQGIDSQHLEMYTRVLNRRGTGLAVVRDRVCQGCYMSVNQQEIMTLKLAQELVSCRGCSRILYLDE